MPHDSWVKFVDECEKCNGKRGPFGGVYARGKRMAVCFTCYNAVSKNAPAYGKQVERYRAKGI